MPPTTGVSRKPLSSQVCAAAHMQDDGQLVVLRELELGFVKLLLLGQVLRVC